MLIKFYFIVFLFFCNLQIFAQQYINEELTGFNDTEKLQIVSASEFIITMVDHPETLIFDHRFVSVDGNLVTVNFYHLDNLTDKKTNEYTWTIFSSPYQ